MQFAYKAFYRVFDYFSYIAHPARRRRFLADGQAGGAGASCSFPSATCSCAASAPSPASSRPASITSGPSGCSARSTNNLLKNIGWAKKGILSFSNTPLNMLSFAGRLARWSLTSRADGAASRSASCCSRAWCRRASRPPSCSIMFFGSLNFFGIGILGEYLAKVFEEVKRRPHFIRRSIIRDGEVRMVADLSQSAAGDRLRK